MRTRNIVVLGCTGSIGASTAKVARDLSDRIRIVGLAAGRNVEGLATQANEFNPLAVCIADPALVTPLKEKLRYPCSVFSGQEGLVKLATLPEADLVLVAIVGTAGVVPTLAAIQAGKTIAIASKEILVMAGSIVMAEARKHGVQILAVDSEHSAIFQCLDDKPRSSVRKLWLTASGGPFRTTPKEQFEKIKVEEALNHPRWSMGKKITIDSATLFNKGLELIEARWLFDIEIDRIDVIIHPQSIIHSMVEFVDGSILAQLSMPDMYLPILYALTYPERVPNARVQTPLTELGPLTFEKPDLERFPALRLARRAGKIGGTMPAVLNAANEVAVEAFLNGKTTFNRIPEIVQTVMEKHQVIQNPTLKQIFQADAWARQEAAKSL